MRIGIYKDTLANKRGADVAVLALADGLRERGHEAVVFEKGELTSRLAEQWDVVVSSGTNEILDLAAAFPEKFPWPVVQQFHTNPKSQFKWKRFRRNRAVKAALKRVAVLQVLSESFIPQVSKYGARVEAIGNWSKYPLSEGECRSDNVIIYPAAFGGDKNHALLLKAFARIADDFPDWELRLYGRGDAPKSLPQRVKLMGYCDLAEAYRQCSFVAFPSLDEGFGLVLADAAMFGKPSLMIHDWIGLAKAGGGIVTRATVSAYADGLRRFMSDPELCKTMGAKARDFCAHTYSREKILDRWERLLLDCSR